MPLLVPTPPERETYIFRHLHLYMVHHLREEGVWRVKEGVASGISRISSARSRVNVIVKLQLKRKYILRKYSNMRWHGYRIINSNTFVYRYVRGAVTKHNPTPQFQNCAIFTISPIAIDWPKYGSHQILFETFYCWRDSWPSCHGPWLRVSTTPTA